MPAATATADPPLDPPGMRSSAHGLFAGPNAEFSVDDPIANSSQLVLPTMTAPAACSRSTTVASYGGTNVSRIRDDAVVRMPRVQMLSLSATGTPASGADGELAAATIDVGGARERALRADGVERVQRAVHRLDAIDGRAAGLDGGPGARADAVADL